MSAPGPVRPSAGAGLLAKLMAEVRPEFRADIVIPQRGALVFDESGCRVPDCERQPRNYRLCNPHYAAWVRQERPDLDQFAAAASPAAIGGYGLRECAVPGCRFGSHGSGMCSRHYTAWLRDGRPDRTIWFATLAPVPLDHPVCVMPTCSLWTIGRSQFCDQHRGRWTSAGRPPLAEFVALVESYGNDRYDFRAFGERRQLKLEMQYALQCRHDERRSKTRYGTARTVIAFVASTDVDSLLDWPAERWNETFKIGRRGHASQLGFLRYAHRRIDDLHIGTGWETEYPRDIWELRRVGLDGNHRLRFDDVPQFWLRELAKRFARWRLSVGRGFNLVYQDVRAIARFSKFLASPTIQITSPADITRAVLERYLADLATDTGRAVATRNRDLMTLNVFFDAIRRYEWNAALPTTAAFYKDDYSARARRLPRALAEHIMAQLEHPANLDRWTHPEDMLITIILMRCGLRIGDACRIGFDCVIRDAEAAPYLRYTNHKMKREALVPIDEEVEHLIADQQQRVRERWPAASPWLFPAAKLNPDGKRPWTSYRQRLRGWLQCCEICDEHARPVHLTPHQWRHTFGTRLINRDVPQEVVRRLLDHSSSEMTAHYARLHDTTVRRHWEKARKVNAVGETITLGPNGPLAEAQWAKQRLGRATQALPNGYCGLPVQKTCPHANACLTCPMFITTAEFLPNHRDHRQQVLQIITAAEARGQQRLAEMNQQVLGNLEKIITTLENDTDTGESADAC